MACVLHYWDTHNADGAPVSLTAHKALIERYCLLAGVELKLVPSCFPATLQAELPCAYLENDVWQFEALWNRLLRQKPLEIADPSVQRECGTWTPLALLYLSDALEYAVWKITEGPDSFAKGVVHSTMPNWMIAFHYVWKSERRTRHKTEVEGTVDGSCLQELLALIQRRRPSPFLYGHSPSVLDVILSAFGHCFRQLPREALEPEFDKLWNILAILDDNLKLYVANAEQTSNHNLPQPGPLPAEARHSQDDTVSKNENDADSVYGDGDASSKKSPKTHSVALIMAGVVAAFLVSRAFNNR